AGGVWPRPDFQAGPQQWLTHTVVYAAIAFIVYYARSLAVQATRNAEEELAERVRAEAALRASEDKFSAAFHDLPVDISINRLSDGSYVDVNEPPQPSLGRTRNELLGRSALDIGIWPDPAKRHQFFATLRKEGHVKGYEAQLRHASGALVDC